DVFAGREPAPPPRLGDVVVTLLEHAELLAEWCGELPAMRAFRKHAAWYTKCFRDSARLRERLAHVGRLAELRAALADVDAAGPFPLHALRVPRGKHGGQQRVALPDGYLDRLDDDTPPGPDAEDPASGG